MTTQADGVGTSTAVDPITAQIIRHGIDAAADQMLVALKRTAFSPIIYDVLDGAGALYDRRFRMLTQMEMLPLFTGSLEHCIEGVVAHYADGAGLQPGDVLLVNDPWLNGTHQWDMTVIVPSFYDGALVAYAAIKAHHLDVGAIAPFVSDSTDVFQEGTIYPGIKIYRGGVRDDDIFRIVVANTRLPEMAEGDLNGQIGACRVGLNALHAVIDRYGLEQFEAATEMIFDYGEARMRAALAEFPDGRHVVRSINEHNGREEVMLEYEIGIEIDGTDVTVDLSDAPPAQAGPTNTPPSGTLAAVRCALMAIAAGDERTNEGYFRAIHLKTKPGTQFHAERPSPCANAFAPLLTLINRIQEALGNAAPERMPAGFGQNVSLVMFGTDFQDRFWADSINMVGGAPASAVYGDAGGPLFDFGCSGLRLVSWEVWEAKTPMLVQRCEYVPDTGGVGQYRGGPGVDLVVEALLDMSITIVSERETTPPHALAGGQPGRPTNVWLHTPEGSERHQKGTYPMPKGSTVDVRFSGGGSYGPPEARDPAAVREDIVAGVLTEEGARAAYPHAF